MNKNIFTPATKFIITIILTFNVFMWNLAPTSATTSIQQGIQTKLIEKSEPIKDVKIGNVEAQPQSVMLIGLAIVVIVVAAVICYVIIKAADHIPAPQPPGNDPDDQFYNNPTIGIVDGTPVTQWPLPRSIPGIHLQKCNIVIVKSYDRGNTWTAFTNIYDYPDSWEVRDYAITNRIIPIYKAYKLVSQKKD